VYCRSGRRSGIAQSALEEAGYTNVVNVGGLEDARNKAAEKSVN
jgi:phage shock protein E